MSVKGHAFIRFWRWPVLLGIAFAFIKGLHDSLPMLHTHAYGQFHLYRTALRILVPAMDAYVLPAIVAFSIISLAGWLTHRVAGPNRRPLPVLASLVAAVALASYGLATHAAWRMQAQRTAADLATDLQPALTNPAALMVLLAILLAAAWRVFARRRRTEAAPAPARSSPRWAPVMRRVAASVTLGLISLLSLAYALTHGAAWFLDHRAARALRDRPNIIFIMVDTLRADHVGCYGYDLSTTPNIDRFARECLRFEDTIAQSSWTLWSVSSLMTSRYPDRLISANGSTSLDLGLGLHAYFPTLPEVLKEQGYSTSAIISNPMLTKIEDNAQGYDLYDDSIAFLNTECTETSPHVNARALDRVREVKERPFFLYALYMDPHDPYHQNPGFVFGDAPSDRPLRELLANRETPEKIAERRASLRRYDSEIAYTDHYVGELLEALKREGLYDNALIVLFSDHGEEFLEHGNYLHMTTVYQEVTRVPLLVKLPRQREGKVVQGTFPLIDLYPSLMAYLGVDASALGLQGTAVDFASVLRCADKAIYSSTVEQVQGVMAGGQKLIRTGNPVTKQELYDLPADPVEQVNLAEARAPTAARLASLLSDRDAQVSPVEVAALAVATGQRARRWLRPDQALLDRLRGLGYVGFGSSDQ